jgi:capsular polysaccharide biosynthesis protein/cell division septation protein DedD
MGMKPPPSSRKSLRDFFHVIFKRKLQILLFFLITVCVILTVTFTTESIYEAKSQIETFYFLSGSGDASNPHIGAKQEEHIRLSIEILTGHDLAQQVARDLGPTVIYKNLTKKTEGVDDNGKTLRDQQTLLEKAAWQIRKDITAERGNKPSAIEVRFRHTDRYMATAVANKLAALFLDHNISQGEGRNIAQTLALERTVKRARIQPAIPPENPIKPRFIANFMLAIFAGFLGAFVLALVREYMDDSLEKSEDIEDTLELPVLAFIPEKDRIMDEMIGNIEKPEVRDAEVKVKLPAIRFILNPKWLLVICLIIMAGVYIVYQGLVSRETVSLKSPPQIAKKVYSAKIERGVVSGENEGSIEGGQSDLEHYKEKPKSVARDNEKSSPYKGFETGFVKENAHGNRLDGPSAVVFQQEVAEEKTDMTLQKEATVASIVDTKEKNEAVLEGQSARLSEGIEKKQEGSVHGKEKDDSLNTTPRGMKKKNVDEKLGHPETAEKEQELALPQKPKDFYIQVAAFGTINRAEIASENLKEKGFEPFILESDTKKNRKLYRIRVRFDAQEIVPTEALRQLKEQGYKDCFRVR